MSEYLLEIGLEEIPARFLQQLGSQLAERTAAFLGEQRLSYETIDQYITPRRLAVMVKGLSERQTPFEEKVKGPSLKVAKDEAGQWSKAAQGFLRSQNAQEEDIVIESLNGVEYLYVNKIAPQRAANDVLREMVQVVKEMQFPVSMTWSDLTIQYIRPIHWIVSLLDEEIIPFEFAGVNAGRSSSGHRFLSTTKYFEIDHVANYQSLLMDNFVIADFEARKNKIKNQIEEISRANNWFVPKDANLLDEVTAIVEWPTAFYGEFDEKFLTVPHMVLITAMRDHQRYFHALDPENETLLPVFISVRNGNEQHIENVINGNQKVLRARLEDTLFFYDEDLKHSIDEYVHKLSSVNEHYKLGTLADKQLRVQKIIEQMLEKLEIKDTETQAALKRAAEIYKFDLVTHVVDEFAELQGQMGAIYAARQGESPQVVNALKEQYLPIRSHGDLPETREGAVLAVADKLDTIISYFKAGMIPTGSNDPYALRRAATGIVEITENQEWNINFREIIEPWIPQNNEAENNLLEEIESFIKARIQVFIENRKVAYDLVHAVLKVPHLNILRIIVTGEKLQKLRTHNEADFRYLIENLARVVNLGSKVSTQVELDLNLAQTKSETQLMAAVSKADKEAGVTDQLKFFQSIYPVIEAYFEENMVNAEDEKIKYNRYQLMFNLTELILNLFDPREVVSK